MGAIGKTIRQKTNFVEATKFFGEWQTVTKAVQKAKRLRSKVLVERQFQVVKALYEHANVKKTQKSIMMHCLGNYSQRLARMALLSLKDNIMSRQGKRNIMQQIQDYYNRKMFNKSLTAIKLSMSERKKYQKIVECFQEDQEERSMKTALQKLNSNRIKQQFKRSYKPFLDHRNENLMAKCFLALREWGSNHADIRNKLSSHLSHKQGCTMESAFESILQYAAYSREQREFKARAQKCLSSNLLAKAFHTLLIHR